jgi:hypothetical protein
MLFIKLKNILNILKTYKNIFIFLLFILIVYIIYGSNKNKNKNKNENKNFETNSYLENYGNKLKSNISQTTFEIFHNKLNSNIDLLSIKNNEQQKYKIQNIEYHPLIKKVSNVIIGRYKLKNKDIIKIIYYNVNEYLLVNICKKDNKKNKNLDNILNDKYKLNETIDKITLNVSRILFYIVNDPLTKIFIGQYIINKSNSNFEINNIYKGIIDIAKNSKYSVDIRMNAVDILNLSNNKKYIEISKTLIKSIRNIRTENANQKFENHLNTVINNVKTKKQNQIQINKNTNIPQSFGNVQLLVDIDGNTFPIPPDIDTPPLQRQIEIKKPSVSIYEDGQNVHNTKVNESTLNTASELINKYNPTTRIEYTYYNKLYKDEKIKKIENSIHRINTDTSTFGKGFNLYSVFQSLLNLIEQHPQKNELNERLIDELIDMSGKCSTGHLSRLINVLQGFETNLKIKVEIDIKDEIYAKIKHLIEKNIIEQENMDEIMEDILSENKTIYIEFIKNTINNNISEMLNEYKNVDNKEVIKEIINALDKYTGTTNNFLFLKK